MNDEKEKVPKVFISYSHDSPSHKKWVGEIASRLVENGIDVILDQWDLGLGDDVAKFMEQGVTEADRVLMICTEPYVRKADEGEGGVGYEAMIVTGELVRDLGTSKFIPIIRQVSGTRLLPRSVSTRFYVNLSEGENFEGQFEELLRELHQAPAIVKPPLGKSPFAKQPSGIETPANIEKHSPMPRISELNEDIAAIYLTALELARQGDIVAWRRVIRQAKQPIGEQLAQWRVHQESNPPPTKDDLLQVALEGTSVFAPLFCIALAGVESGRNKFRNQISLLDLMLHPKGWNLAGSTDIVDLPDTIAYIYQALHGAMCLQTDQLDLALNLASTRVERHYESEKLPLYLVSEIIGWPESLGRDCVTAWNFLTSLPDKWPWLEELYGAQEEFSVAVSAYYMSLHILELTHAIATGAEEAIRTERVHLIVPVCFLAESHDIKRQAYKLLLQSPDNVRDIWRNQEIDDDKIAAIWPHWIRQAGQWLFKVYGPALRRRMPHEELLKDLG